MALGAPLLRSKLAANEADAHAVMQEIAQAVCSKWARTVLYVPAAVGLDIDRRNEAIFAAYGQDGPDGVKKFSGERIQQLASEFQLTPAHLYMVFKAVRRYQRAAAIAGEPQSAAQSVAA